MKILILLNEIYISSPDSLTIFLKLHSLYLYTCVWRENMCGGQRTAC